MFGIEGFNAFSEKSETVAVVDGRKIGKIEWEAAVKEDAERLRRNNPKIDPRMFDSDNFKYSSLEQLVNRKVLAVAAEKLYLNVSDQKLAKELLNNPELSHLRLPNGRIDEEKYKELLRPFKLTPQTFEAQVRSDLSVQQLLQSLSQSNMVPAVLADLALNAYFDRREIQILDYKAEDFIKSAKPTESEIEAFYKANSGLFQAPENASIQYVVLDLADIEKSIVPTEAELKNYYEQNASQFSGNEERRASHILINAPASAKAEEREKAKKQAESLLLEIKKSPNRFAELAKKNSQDPGSAVKGGDLGFFTRGVMVKPFEAAAFSMQPNQLSDVVESDFGYHIIQLHEIKTPKKRSFAEARPEIELELKKRLAQKKYSEVSELFTNMVYEQSDSLRAVADKFKLAIQTAGHVTRQVAPGAAGVLSNQKFLSALFSTDSIEKKRNTEAIEIGPRKLVAGRIATYSPTQTESFAQVRDKAQSLLMQKMALDMARKAGAARLQELNATGNKQTLPTGLSAPLVVSRDMLQQQSPRLVDAVLRANASNLPIWIGVDLGSDGYRLVRINRLAEEGVEAVAKQNREQYLQVWSNAENASYFDYLKNKFKVEIKVKKPASPVSNLKRA